MVQASSGVGRGNSGFWRTNVSFKTLSAEIITLEDPSSTLQLYMMYELQCDIDLNLPGAKVFSYGFQNTVLPNLYCIYWYTVYEELNHNQHGIVVCLYS